ncbi:RAVE subunit 2/Rogdi [Cunninghamella echinulata]|nr:RAVE subunit 2/Rogdi [Cunninghamella echinulata]
MHSKIEVTKIAELERDWILKDILPTGLLNLKEHISKSLDILATAPNKTDALALSTTQNETIKGYVNFTGTYINKAEIQVRLPNFHPETPIKAIIQPTLPYFLEQAQQCKNYIILANKLIQEYQKPLSKQKAIEFFDSMCHLMDRALYALDYPNELTLFPYKVCHPKFFSPPLRQDLVVEFCINDVYIVCNVYAIDNNNHSTRKLTDRQHHHHVTYKDKMTEIIGEAKTQTQSPMLTQLKASLDSIRIYCQTYKRMLLQIQA